MFSVCGTKASPSPRRLWAGSRVMSRDPSRTLPPAIGTSPAMALTKVLLPAPFGPSTARISPAAMPSEAPSTIGRPGS